MLQLACLCPNSCENNDARQMRMTNKETRHAPKSMLTSIGPRQKGTSAQESLQEISSALIVWEQTHCVSSIPFRDLRSFHLSVRPKGTFVLFTVRFSHRQLLVFIHDWKDFIPQQS